MKKIIALIIVVISILSINSVAFASDELPPPTDTITLSQDEVLIIDPVDSSYSKAKAPYVDILHESEDGEMVINGDLPPGYETTLPYAAHADIQNYVYTSRYWRALTGNLNVNFSGFRNSDTTGSPGVRIELYRTDLGSVVYTKDLGQGTQWNTAWTWTGLSTHTSMKYYIKVSTLYNSSGNSRITFDLTVSNG